MNINPSDNPQIPASERTSEPHEPSLRSSLSGMKRRHRPKLIAVFPTLLTLGNAICGFGAITFAAKVGPETTEGNHLLVAGILIFLAMLFDMLDGSAARWANQTSDFGAQLDSLCDSVSFGVAPAFLMLQFSRAYHPRLLWVIAVLYVLCALLRLARFNVETDEEDAHEGFSGLPSPAAAGMVASFPIAMRGVRDLIASPDDRLMRLGEFLEPALRMTLPFVTLAVAMLMVSRFRYAHVFNQFIRGQKSRPQMVQLIFTILIVFLVQELALALVFGYFAFSVPIAVFWKELGRKEAQSPNS